MTRFLPSQVPAQITAASRLRKTTCFNIRKNSGKISLTRTCKSDIIGNSLSGHGGIGRRVRFRFLWSQGCAGSSPVARTKTIKTNPKGSFFILSINRTCSRFLTACKLCLQTCFAADAPLRSRYSVASLLTSPASRTKIKTMRQHCLFL